MIDLSLCFIGMGLRFISSKNIVGIEIDDYVACFFLIIFFLYYTFYVQFTFFTCKKIRSDKLQSIEFDEMSSLHWLGSYMQLFFILFNQKNRTYPSYTFDMTRFVSVLVIYVQILIGIASIDMHYFLSLRSTFPLL